MSAGSPSVGMGADGEMSLPRDSADDSAEAQRWVRRLHHNLDQELSRLATPAPPKPAESWVEVAELAHATALRRARTASEPQARRLALRLARELDDLPRRRLFARLAQARQQSPESADLALTRTRDHLGDADGWLPAFRRHLGIRTARLVTVLTWQCPTRCTYCTIPKQDGREMSLERLSQAVDLLMSSGRRRVELHFFGGEPMMRWEAIQHGISQTRAACSDRHERFLLTTNGQGLTPERLEWLAEHPVHLQVALDGQPQAHDTHRRALDGGSSYARSAIHRGPLIRQLGIDCTAILVVHPARVAHMLDDIAHVADKGFARIQLNWAHNMFWHPRHRQRLARGLHELSDWLRERWAQGRGPWVANLDDTLAKIRVYREITVDWEGTVLAGNAFLFRPEEREHLVLGHLDQGHAWERYRLDGPSDAELLERAYAPPVRDNNARVGALMNRWVRWMGEQGLPEDAPGRRPPERRIRREAT